MATSVEKPRDVLGGLLILGIGTTFLLSGRELELGTSFRMGPGYFPTVLSVILMALGAALAGLAWRGPREEGFLGLLPWRGLVLIIGATVVFGLSLRGLGLAPVLAIVVLATAWASRYAAWRTSLPLALGIAVFCSLLFIRGLGLPLPLMGTWLNPATWSPPATSPAPAP